MALSDVEREFGEQLTEAQLTLLKRLCTRKDDEMYLPGLYARTLKSEFAVFNPIVVADQLVAKGLALVVADTPTNRAYDKQIYSATGYVERLAEWPEGIPFGEDAE